MLCTPSVSRHRVICKDERIPPQKATAARASLSRRGKRGRGAIPAGWRPSPSASPGDRLDEGMGTGMAADGPEATAAHVSAPVLQTEIDKLLKWRFSSDGSEMPFLFSWRFCKLKRESGKKKRSPLSSPLIQPAQDRINLGKPSRGESHSNLKNLLIKAGFRNSISLNALAERPAWH